MLRIRRFQKGVDEQTWVKILNAAYREFRDWRTITLEESISEERKPDFQTEGRFIAEIDGQPVGIVNAHVDGAEGEKKGLIEDLAVTPEFRNSGVEYVLTEFAVNALGKHAVNAIQVPRLHWFHQREKDRVEFLEKLGFRLIGKTSLMETSLAGSAHSTRDNADATILPCQKQSDKDIETLSMLRNECNKELPGFRPTSFEEIKHLLLSNPCSYFAVFLALHNAEHVGYIVAAIDEKYNVEKGVKAGIILGIGVLKAHRRKGIGTALIKHALNTLKAEGMTKAVLDVDDFNQTGAFNLYQEVGFSVVEKYLTYEKAGENALRRLRCRAL